MPNPWWEWADNLADQVENLEAENHMLSQNVEFLESNVENLKKKMDNLLTLLAAMQPEESSSNTNGENDPVTCANNWHNPLGPQIVPDMWKGVLHHKVSELDGTRLLHEQEMQTLPWKQRAQSRIYSGEVGD